METNTPFFKKRFRLAPPPRLLALVSAILPGLLFCLLVLTWLQHPLPVSANFPPFDTQTLIGIGSISMVPGDIDGDGDLDIIIAGTGNEQNRIYINDGSGSFPDTRNFGNSNDNTRSVAVADLNGDGHLDIIEGNVNEQNRIYWNDGSGFFNDNRKLVFGQVETTKSVAVADLNGDGHLDIIEGNGTNAWGEQNRIYLNDGSGSFPESQNIGNANKTQSVAVADLNGDGYLDIIAGNNGESNSIYWNFGSEILTDITSFGLANGATRSVAVADLNGDGRLDIIEGNANEQNRIYINDGSGSFPDTRNFGNSNDNTFIVAVADLNGDGHLDIIEGNVNKQNLISWNDGNWNDGKSGFIDTTKIGPDGGTTRSLMAADLNNDGHLDILEGNDKTDYVYWNDGSGSLNKTDNFLQTNDNTSDVHAADLDGDGDLDIIEGNGKDINLQNYIHWNNGSGGFSYTKIGEANPTREITTADLDGDDHLDIIEVNDGQANYIYWNNGSGDFFTITMLGEADSKTLSVETADLDGNGHLDIILGNDGQNSIYMNEGNRTFSDPPSTFGSAETNGLAIGDLNGDGHLDIAVSNWKKKNAVYWNDGSGNFVSQTELLDFQGNFNFSLATADLNGDGYLDIIVGIFNIFVYLNNGSGEFNDIIVLGNNNEARGLDTADINGDGHLDIIAGYFESPNRVFWNNGGGGFDISTPFGEDNITRDVAAADLNGDGHLDIISGNNGKNSISLNNLYTNRGLLNHPPAISVTRPVTTAGANNFSSPQLLTAPVISVPYTLFDQEGDPVGRVAAFYSQDGGDNWQEAVPTSLMSTINLATSPWPTTTITNSHIFAWDTVASGVYGRSDHVVLRLVAYPQAASGSSAISGTFRYTNSVASLNQWPSVSATTFPFSLRGMQAQVLSQTNSGTNPLPGALVYSLPADFTTGAKILQDKTHPNLPSLTGPNGNYFGRPPIHIGDRLVALYPAPSNGGITFTDKISLYYTSAAVSPTLQMHEVITPGLQQLTVSEENNLLLLNLDLSLEWDARGDSNYLEKLETDLEQASQLLFDWTNGQVALGQINVYQNKENWYFSDIVVHASNRYRPNATIGGIATDWVSETLYSNISIPQAYQSGQIRMGATWNRYGNPSGGQVDDWAKALAHEIGHYALFLQDNYFGVVKVDGKEQFQGMDCVGSAMSNPYISSYSEFLVGNGWEGDCLNTMAARVLGLSDWEIILRHYPMLADYGGESFSGPSVLPLQLLEVGYVEPNSEAALADQLVELLAQDGGAFEVGPQTRGYLYKTQGTEGITDDRVVDLGKPTAGGLRVRGLTPGDRLCVFDTSNRAVQTGCAEFALDSTQLITIEVVENWKPEIEVTPISTTTLEIELSLDVTSALSLEGTLMVQLLPSTYITDSHSYNAPAKALAFSHTDTEKAVYRQTVSTEVPTFNGHIRVWVAGATPVKESLTDFLLSGDWPVPGFSGSGAAVPGFSGSGASVPTLSGDGRVLILNLDPDRFFSDKLQIMVQGVTVFPDLPPWLTPVGQGYRLALGEGEALPEGHAINFVLQYLQSEVADAFEDHLHLYYLAHDRDDWQVLPTYRDAGDNLISTPIPDNEVEGQGIYVLVTAVFAPPLDPGWNEFVFPLPGTQQIEPALASIADSYSSVYGFDLDSFTWQLYDQAVITEHPEFESYVNTLSQLKFGQSYWIFATQTVTPIIPTQANSRPVADQEGVFLPATYYGEVFPSETYTPMAGDAIEAWMNSTRCGQTALIEPVDGDGKFIYVIQVQSGFGQNCGGYGQNISFLVVNNPILLGEAEWDNRQAYYLPFGLDPVAALDLKTYLPVIVQNGFPLEEPEPANQNGHVLKPNTPFLLQEDLRFALQRHFFSWAQIDHLWSHMVKVHHVFKR